MSCDERIEFTAFWRLYPRKDAKASARVMWDRLTGLEQEAAMAAIPQHVAMWRRQGRNKDKIPHAATWLNPKIGRRWEDELPPEREKDPRQMWNGFKNPSEMW